MKIQAVMLSAVLFFAFSVVSVSAASYTISQGWNMISFPTDYVNITNCINTASVSGTVVRDVSKNISLESSDGNYNIYVTAGVNANWASLAIKDKNGKIVDMLSGISVKNTKDSSVTGLSITVVSVSVAGTDPATQRIEANIIVDRSNQYITLYGNLYNYNPSKNNYDVLTLKYMYDFSMKGRGMWIYKFSKGSCYTDWKGAGSFSDFDSIVLKKGWNQVGAPSDGISMEDFKGNCKIASGPWEYSATQNKYIQSSKLEEGKGYWVYVDKDCTLQKTCKAQGGTCRAWDPLNGNCYSSEKEISPLECSNNLAQTHCCVPKQPEKAVSKPSNILVL